MRAILIPMFTFASLVMWGQADLPFTQTPPNIIEEAVEAWESTVVGVVEQDMTDYISLDFPSADRSTITSVQRGIWSESTTWDCECVPSGGDNIVVDHEVSFAEDAEFTRPDFVDWHFGGPRQCHLDVRRQLCVFHDAHTNGVSKDRQRHCHDSNSSRRPDRGQLVCHLAQCLDHSRSGEGDRTRQHRRRLHLGSRGRHLDVVGKRLGTSHRGAHERRNPDG